MGGGAVEGARQRGGGRKILIVQKCADMLIDCYETFNHFMRANNFVGDLHKKLRTAEFERIFVELGIGFQYGAGFPVVPGLTMSSLG